MLAIYSGHYVHGVAFDEIEHRIQNGLLRSLSMSNDPGSAKNNALIDNFSFEDFRSPIAVSRQTSSRDRFEPAPTDGDKIMIHVPARGPAQRSYTNKDL